MVSETGQVENGVWMSLSDLARSEGVSPQAITKRVNRLEGEGHTLTRRGPGRQRLVNVALWKTITGQAEAILNSASEPTPTRSAKSDAQTRNLEMQAALRAIQLAEARGQLVRATGPDSVEEAAVKASYAIIQGLSSLGGDLERDLVDLIEGEHRPALRKAIKAHANRVREMIARVMVDQAVVAKRREAEGAVSIWVNTDEVSGGDSVSGDAS